MNTISNVRRPALALLAAAVLLASAPATSLAHDDEHKRIGGLVLKMQADPAKPTKRKFVFKTKEQTAISGIHALDPTSVATSVIVRGTGLTDGSTGVIKLDPTKWSRAGASGWKYVNKTLRAGSGGISKILIRNGTIGGSLQIVAKGFYWPYLIAGPQEEVEIFLNIGGDTYCAQYGADPDELVRNQTGRVQGKRSNPPADCNPICGNAIQEIGEECDDGNDIDADTCTNECTGCLADDVEHASTFEAIQALIFDSPVYACSNDTCHGNTAGGGLDLRAGTSYSQLVGVASSAPPNPQNALRVQPGDQDLSFLYNKIAAKTLGTPDNVGTPMPVGPATVSVEHLEAIRLWIRGGAPETTTVAGTSELFGACLPEAAPLKIPKPDAPAPEVGVQFAMPGYDLPSQSETELCVPTFYDLTGLVDPAFVVPCPMNFDFPGTNPSNECFAWSHQSLAQDPQSHHSIIHIYRGVHDVTHPSWGPWKCYLGDDDGMACDPQDSGACPGGVCGGKRSDTVACIGFGPPDWGFQNNNAPSFGGAQEATSQITYPEGVYSLLPLRGIIGWNSHAFNLTTSDMNMEAWLNLHYTDQQTYPAQALFNSTHIFAQNVLPFQTAEYCHTHTFAEGTRLIQISSHMHKRGKRFRWYNPPQTPCTNPASCTVGAPGDLFYESTDYSDPLTITYDPPRHFTGTVAQRTLKFCALYDNGFNDPAEVKRRSNSPCPPNGCGLIPGGPCGPGGDPTNPNRYCVGGPNKAGLCTSDTDCPGSLCDACMLKGGVTTEDEMFIGIGTYFVQP